MEGPSNGVLLYHEVQEAKLCAVHCVNTVLQGPFFSEFDLGALAADLDRKERQMLMEGRGGGQSAGAGVIDEGFGSQESHNVSMVGDFSIQVVQKALEVWDLQVIPLESPVAEAAQIDPELENAFICHLQDHWFCIRKVDGEWYNFDSLYAAPQHLSRFYLSAYLDTLRGGGWSIFLVRCGGSSSGSGFPKDFSSDSGYGQWLTPDGAARILKACSNNAATSSNDLQYQQPPHPRLDPYSQAQISAMEDEDLKAAISASLMDSAMPTHPSDVLEHHTNA
ncbi:hypothetical protein V2J09_000532 [Rumex salicifolius]